MMLLDVGIQAQHPRGDVASNTEFVPPVICLYRCYCPLKPNRFSLSSNIQKSRIVRAQSVSYTHLTLPTILRV